MFTIEVMFTYVNFLYMKCHTTRFGKIKKSFFFMLFYLFVASIYSFPKTVLLLTVWLVIF